MLALAQAESRLLLTFDKDFEELAFRSGLPATSGIVLFRLPLRDPSWVAAFITARLREPIDWLGWFTVVEPAPIRRSPLDRG